VPLTAGHVRVKPSKVSSTDTPGHRSRTPLQWAHSYP